MYGKSIPIHRTPFMTGEEAEVVVLWMEQEEEAFTVQYIVILFPLYVSL